MARPPGSRQARPTREAIKSYYAMLRNAADKGDLNAAGKLIELDHLTSTERRTARQETAL